METTNFSEESPDLASQRPAELIEVARKVEVDEVLGSGLDCLNSLRLTIISFCAPCCSGSCQAVVPTQQETSYLHPVRGFVQAAPLYFSVLRQAIVG